MTDRLPFKNILILILISFILKAIASASEIVIDEALGYKEGITLNCDLSNPQFYLVPPPKPKDENEKTTEKTAEGGETKQEPTEILIENKEGKYNVTGNTLFIEDLSKILNYLKIFFMLVFCRVYFK